jgi:hypothetical protein
LNSFLPFGEQVQTSGFPELSETNASLLPSGDMRLSSSSDDQAISGEEAGAARSGFPGSIFQMSLLPLVLA